MSAQRQFVERQIHNAQQLINVINESLAQEAEFNALGYSGNIDEQQLLTEGLAVSAQQVYDIINTFTVLRNTLNGGYMTYLYGIVAASKETVP